MADDQFDDLSSRPQAATTSGAPSSLSALDAKALLAHGQLSAVALLDACEERAGQLDGAVNALVTPGFAAAREAAAAADAAQAHGQSLGVLHGIPVAIKDIQDVAGVVTSWGSEELAESVAAVDSPIVARIRRAGGIVIGKTNVPEKSIGANTVNPLFGATGNPYAPELTCGGSSGGSAVAVATQMAPLATGSDHGGSLRIPACYCGVVGMRATPGMVPNEQRKFPHTNYAVQGPMARTVGDVALLLSVIAERDSASAADPMVFPFAAESLATPEPCDPGQLRVGYSEDLGGVLVSTAVREQFRARLAAIAPRVRTLAPCKLDLRRAPSVDWHLRQELFAAAYAAEADQWPEDFNPNVRATYESAIATPMQEIALAKKVQLELTRHMAAQFAEFDVVIVPGVSIPPFPWRQLNPAEIDGQPVVNYMAWLELTAALTVVGHPVVALPCGLDAAGTPFGIQVVGRMYGDRELLGAAIALEAAFAEDDLLRAPQPDFAWLQRQDAGCKTLGRLVQAGAG